MSKQRSQQPKQQNINSYMKPPALLRLSEESHQGLSMNVNLPSSHSKRRFTDDHRDWIDAKIVGEFTVSGSIHKGINESNQRIQHQQPTLSGDNQYKQSRKNNEPDVVRNSPVRGDTSLKPMPSWADVNINDRRSQTTNIQNSNPAPPNISDENSSSKKNRKSILPVHYQGKLGPIPAERMDDDEDSQFEPIFDSNQSLIDNYLTGSLSRKQTEISHLTNEEREQINRLRKLCEVYYKQSSPNNDNFQTDISAYIYLRQGKLPTSLGNNIGNYLVKNGLFLLAYAKYSAESASNQHFLNTINGLAQYVETDTAEFIKRRDRMRRYQTEKIIEKRKTQEKEKLNKEIQQKSATEKSSAKAQKATSNNVSGRESDLKGHNLPLYKQGSQANYNESQTSLKKPLDPQPNSPERSVNKRSKKIPKKKSKQSSLAKQEKSHRGKKSKQKMEQDDQEPQILGMAYKHIVMDNEIALVKRSMRVSRERNQSKSKSKNQSHHQKSENRRKKSSKSSKRKTEYNIDHDNVQDIIKHLDKYDYNPKWTVQNDVPMTHQDLMLHEQLQKRYSSAKKVTYNEDSTNQQDIDIIKTPSSHGPIQQDSHSDKKRKSHQKINKREQKKESQSRNKHKHTSKSKKQLNAPKSYDDPVATDQQNKKLIKQRFEEFNKIKHKFAPPAEIEPTVEVIDPNVDNMGIYALVKLDPLTRYELNEEFAVVPLPTFPKKGIDVQRRKLIQKTFDQCKKKTNRQTIAWIAYTQNVGKAIEIERQKRKKMRKKSDDNCKTTPDLVDNPSIEYLNRPMSNHPSKQSMFSETKFIYDQAGKLQQVIAPGCEHARLTSKSKPKTILSAARERLSVGNTDKFQHDQNNNSKQKNKL